MQPCEQDFLPYAAISSVGPGPAIVFAPHPDDEVFGCGGAIMRHVSSGDPVRVVIISDGAYGSPADSEEYARTRQRESTEAGAILGYGTPEFWNLPDRGLEYGEQLTQRILTAIEGCAAELVYAPSWWEIHPDHRVTALAVNEAVRRCARPIRLAMYEVGVPLQPNALLDITDLAERKASAVACFSSQLAQQDYGEQIAALNRFRTYTLPRAVQAAEAYLVLSAEELRNGIPGMMTRKDRLAVRGETCDMAATPLISVIIRSMDRAQLKDALDSVALQTYPRIEVIVVDAKGDGHAPLAPWCGRFPLRFIPSNVPLSRSRAANAGLEQARGEYLIFLDDDDVFYPDHIAELIAAIKDTRDVRCVYSGVWVKYFVAGQLANEGAFNQPFLHEKLRGRNFIPIHAVLFHRSLLDAGCRFDESLDLLEDWDFWLQLAEHTRFLHVDRISACYRNYGESGFGEKLDADLLTRATSAVFEKWKNRWSGAQWAEIILYRDAQRDESEHRAAELQARADQQDRALTEARQQLKANEAEAETIRNSLAAREAELTLLRDILADRETRLEQTQQRSATADLELADVRADLASRAMELDAIRIQLAASIAELAETKAQMAASSNELDGLRSEVSLRVAELESNHRIVADLTEHQRRLSNELESALTWAHQMQRSLDAIFRSTSWQATAPLRLLSHILQGRYEEAWASLRRRLHHQPLQAPASPHTAGNNSGPGLSLQRAAQENPYTVWMRLNRPLGNHLRIIARQCGSTLFPRTAAGPAPDSEAILIPMPQTRSRTLLPPNAGLRKESIRSVNALMEDCHRKVAGRFASNTRFAGSPYLLGYAALGPVLLGFTQWLIRSTELQRPSAFCFLSRDGYYLKAAYDMAAERLGPLPPSHYVAASRSLCTLAALTSLDHILEAAAVDHYPMAIGRFLSARFGFSQHQLDELPQSLLIEAGVSHLHERIGRDDRRKTALLRRLAPRILEHSAMASERYTDYLRKTGIDWQTSPLVDIGYSGTAQAEIARLLQVDASGRYLITNRRATKLQSQGLTYDSWLGKLVDLDHPFFRHVQLWELFLSATHGSIIDIDETDLTPLHENYLFDAYSRSMLTVLRKGALDFVGDFLKHHKERFFDFDLPAAACAHSLTRFFESPDAEDCVFLSRIIFEDRFGGEVRALISVPGEPPLAGVDIPATCIWQEASRALTGPDPVTPFWPSEPGTPDMESSAHPNWSVDGVAGLEISPACRSESFARHFDALGFPVACNLKIPVRMVVPVMDSATDIAAVLNSLNDQLIGGFSVDLGCLPGICQSADEPYTFPTTRHEVQDLEELLEIARRPGADWILLTDGSTLLAPTALAELSTAIRDADIVISDDDESDAAGRGQHPHFKPTAFSPELLASTDYFGGAWLIRRDLLVNISSEAQEPRAWLWEIALKAGALGARVAHIPRVLTHRPSTGPSDQVSRAQAQANAFVRAHMLEQGVTCTVVTPEWAKSAGELVCQPVFPDEGPAVAILIPTRNQHRVVARCIDSLAATTYRNYHIYLIDNDSDDPEAVRYFQSLHGDRISVLQIANPPGAGFSYSRVNNRAVERTQGEEYLLFLNNDTEVIEPRWLSQMVGWQRLPGVGSVGALLYFPNDTVQHAGITHKLLWNVLPAPSFKLLPRSEPGYQNYLKLARDSAAQTAACLLTPRSVFIEHGMFDEIDFNVAYNDCDYGFRLCQNGLRNVYCPDAVLYHYEGLTRGRGRGNDHPGEEAAFVQKYAAWDDPFYNPSLATRGTDFAIQPASPFLGVPFKMKLAVATHNLNHEGAPLVLLEIVGGLLRHSAAEVVVFAMEDGPLRRTYEDMGCEVVVLDEASQLFRTGEAAARALERVAGEMAARQAGVVFANTVLCWWAVEAARSIRLPCVWTIHESEPPFSHLREHNHECAERGLNALAYPYRTVFVSWATREVFQNLETTGNFHTIYNGFDTSTYEQRIQGKSRSAIRDRLRIDKSTVMLLLPGTVCQRKSQLDIIQAIPMLDEALIRKIRIFIVGDRPNTYSEELHRQIGQLSPLQRTTVDVLPHCNNIEEYFLAADIMVSTARIEAFPKVIQEGMFFRLPMIVAPVYGIREQLQDEVNALFFAPGNPKELAQQLTRLIDDEELRHRLGETAYVSLNRFPDIHRMVQEYRQILLDACFASS